MIKIANIPLMLPSRELMDYIDRDINIDKMLMLFSRSWPGPGMGFLAMPTHYRRWPPWDRPGSILNRFYWPTGASRWGCGCFLATRDQCVQIHDDCFGVDGDQTNFVPLTISQEDITGTTIEELTVNTITVFPPIPIYRVTNSQDDLSTKYGLYMLLCVDVRYYWWNIPCPDFGISETSGKTWQDVIDMISGEIEEDIIVSEIPTEYLAPHRALNLTNEPLPPIFDAVAANIGARVVLDYSGNVYVQRFDDALFAFNEDVANNPNRKFIAGDSRYLDQF